MLAQLIVPTQESKFYIISYLFKEMPLCLSSVSTVDCETIWALIWDESYGSILWVPRVQINSSLSICFKLFWSVWSVKDKLRSYTKPENGWNFGYPTGYPTDVTIQYANYSSSNFRLFYRRQYMSMMFGDVCLPSALRSSKLWTLVHCANPFCGIIVYWYSSKRPA